MESIKKLLLYKQIKYGNLNFIKKSFIVYFIHYISCSLLWNSKLSKGSIMNCKLFQIKIRKFQSKQGDVFFKFLEVSTQSRISLMCKICRIPSFSPEMMVFKSFSAASQIDFFAKNQLTQHIVNMNAFWTILIGFTILTKKCQINYMHINHTYIIFL